MKKSLLPFILLAEIILYLCFFQTDGYDTFKTSPSNLHDPVFQHMMNGVQGIKVFSFTWTDGIFFIIILATLFFMVFERSRAQ